MPIQNIQNGSNFKEEVKWFIDLCEEQESFDLNKDAQFALFVPKDKKMTKLFGGEDTLPIYNMVIISESDSTSSRGRFVSGQRQKYEVWVLMDPGANNFLRSVSGNSNKSLNGPLKITKHMTRHSKIDKKGKQVAQSSMVYEFSGISGGEFVILPGFGFIITRMHIDSFSMIHKQETGTGEKGKASRRRNASEFSAVAAAPAKNMRK